MTYILQANKTDTLAAELSIDGTSATLTAGNFGSPSGLQVLTLDYNNSAKLEIITCNIAGTALTNITRGVDDTTAAIHSSGATVTMAFAPTHYKDSQNPAGSIIMYGGATAPDGWLLCQGGEVSRTTYAALFAVIGTTYGVGNGTTTFNVPDLQDNFVIGKSGTKALGSTGGAATVDLSHTHTGPSHTHTGTTSVESAWSNTTDTPDIQGYAERNHTHTFTTAAGGTGNTGSGGSSTQSILNPYVAANYIIKT